jgi:hypothetical protein
MTAVPCVEVRETHPAVALAGDRACKAKKPVLTDFLDFRTPARWGPAAQPVLKCRRQRCGMQTLIIGDAKVGLPPASSVSRRLSVDMSET